MFFKHLKTVKGLAILSLFIIVLLLFRACFFVVRINTTVGYVTGNKIYYKDQIYEESYEVFDFNLGKCLGKVKWTDSGTYTKIYSIKNQPEYIYLSMMTDYRIYKSIN